MDCLYSEKGHVCVAEGNRAVSSMVALAGHLWLKSGGEMCLSRGH
jgi:hypothetical protein